MVRYGMRWCVLLVPLWHQALLLPISIVYNFRIGQVTKQPIVETIGKDKSHTFVALFFDQWRNKYCGDTRQNYAGAFGSYILDRGPWYFRTDFAVSHIKEKVDGIATVSDTETDDILLSGGRNVILSDRSNLTFSGLFGFPTHKVLRLQHADFGYSQVGMGGQVDGTAVLNDTSSLIYGARYIHFIHRNARDCSGSPYRLTIGNVADLLVSDKNTWGHHGLEIGYTARFRFGAHICPSFDNFAEKTNYIRSNFYAIYKYKFAIHNVWNRLLFNISYGFDHKSKAFGNKNIVTVWASWNVTF